MADRDEDKTKAQLLAEISELREQLRQVQTQSRDGHVWFDAFMENSPVMARIRDADGRLVYGNPRFIEVAGLGDTAWRGHTMAELFPEGGDREAEVEVEVILAAGRPVKGAQSMKRPGGVQHWLWHEFPFRDADGNSYVGGTAVEITELERTQEELRKSKELAESSTRAKSDFLANMSHEIRTPLHGILGASAVLEDTTLDEESRRYVGVINRSAKSLSSLLSDILDFSNIESGKLHTELAPFDLRQTVRDVYHLLLADAAEKQLSFTVETDGIEINELVGDFGRIRQILINLVGNAIKFTTRGNIELICRSWPIDTPGRRDDDSADGKAKKTSGEPAEPDVGITIEVRDTGIGIAEEQMSKVFDYFAQLDSSTTRAFGGAGLGLAISRRLAQLMGGDLTFQSVKGVGSTFIVNLKLVEYRDEDTLELTRPGISERSYDRAALLVEDNRVNMLIASKMLSKLGLTIDTALNGREAVSKVQDNDYDLVIMDLQMPVMDGIEATRRIRQLKSSDELPIVALTANAMQGTAELCFEAGMNGYLTKPIARKALIVELDRWLK